MADSGVTAAVLSSRVLQEHLFPHLSIFDLLRLERLSTEFKHYLVSADADFVWRKAAASTLPPSHRLVTLTEGD